MGSRRKISIAVIVPDGFLRFHSLNKLAQEFRLQQLGAVIGVWKSKRNRSGKRVFFQDGGSGWKPMASGVLNRGQAVNKRQRRERDRNHK
jgi:hypothetical protein